MSVAQILLLIVGLLAALGLCQRILDKMRLTDRSATLLTFLIFAGGFLPNLSIGGASVNIGGAVIPFAVCVYLFIKADTGYERARAAAASLASAAAVMALSRFFPDEPESMPFDINYLYGIASGAIAALAGRSRRSAFIAGIMGVLTADIVENLYLRLSGVNQTLLIGGGGVWDAAVVSAILAVLLSELTGEFRERCARGAEKHPARVFSAGEIERRDKR